ncbi:MAG: hypothetical protein ACKO3W_07705 [bacterium]
MHVRTQSSSTQLLRSLAFVGVLVLLVVLRAAHAQSSRDVVGGPLTTVRLERLLDAYVRPTPAEQTAIDRRHETYLERYRAEIEPESTKLMTAMSGGQPSKEDFERFLRDLDRLQDTLAEADNQFLSSATELLAEDRRGGMQRVRESRERQRLLSGIVQFAPMMFGGGGGFVDIASRAIREEYRGRVTAENRDAYDATLRSQETRLLSQSRDYNLATRKALSGFYDAMSKLQAGLGEAPEVNDPAALENYQTRQQAMIQDLAALGADVRRVVKSNFEANRSGTAALAALLPESVGLALRIDIADRSANAMGMDFAYGNVSRPGLRTLAPRIERDEALAPEVKAEALRLIDQWRKEHAQASERLAEVLIESAPPMAMMLGGEQGAEEASAARRKLRDAGNQALKRIATQLGDASPRYISTYEGFDEGGTQLEMFRVTEAPKPQQEVEEDSRTSEALRRAGFLDANGGVATPDPITADDVARIGGIVGLNMSEISVIEAVVEGWKSSQWDKEMQPLAERLESLASQRYSVENGDIVYSDSICREYAEGRTRSARIVFELDARLCADLMSALGLANDDPLILLLQLERIEICVARQMGYSDPAVPLAPARIFELARTDPAVAKAIMVGAKAELSALAAKITARTMERMALAIRMQDLERTFARNEQAQVERASAEWSRLIAESTKSDQDFAAEIARTLDDAFDAHAGDATIAASLKQARLRGMYPSIYRTSDSALSQLAAADRLAGLTEDERARIDALAAEYTAMYEKLSAEMVMPANPAIHGGGGEEQWREYQLRAEAIERARFARAERTEKTLGELRRILGSARASEIPGLVKDPDQMSSTDPNRMPWSATDDD